LERKRLKSKYTVVKIENILVAGKHVWKTASTAS
jgi:hypothetical protein